MRGQGAGADRQARQGRRHQAAANTPRRHAPTPQILGMTIGDDRSRSVLIEAQIADRTRALCRHPQRPATQGTDAAVLRHGRHGHRGDRRASIPTPCARMPIDIRRASIARRPAAAYAGLDLAGRCRSSPTSSMKLYARLCATLDAELSRSTRWCMTQDGHVVALDCKFTLDDSAAPRRAGESRHAATKSDRRSKREARSCGLKYIELERRGRRARQRRRPHHDDHGRRSRTTAASPANFLEIGGEAYTKAKTGACDLCSSNPNVKACSSTSAAPSRAPTSWPKASSTPGTSSSPTSRSSSPSTAPARTKPSPGRGAARHRALRPHGRCGQGRRRSRQREGCSMIPRQGDASSSRASPASRARSGPKRMQRLRHQRHRRRQSEEGRRRSTSACRSTPPRAMPRKDDALRHRRCMFIPPMSAQGRGHRRLEAGAKQTRLPHRAHPGRRTSWKCTPPRKAARHAQSSAPTRPAS